MSRSARKVAFSWVKVLCLSCRCKDNKEGGLMDLDEGNEYDHARTMLVLKYGTMQNAYNAWCAMTLDEQQEIDSCEYEILMEYEYNQQYPWYDRSNRLD
jgi:hypothetical protein